MLYLRFKVACKSLSVICRINPSRYSSTDYSILSVLETMQSQRVAEPFLSDIKKEGEHSKASNFAVKLEVVGNGAPGSPRCVLLHTDRAHYFFNCGEGVQRIASEYRLRLSRIPRIFITYPSWENISGLIGTSLTVQNIGIPQLHIHGHSSIDTIYSATTKFVVLRKLGIKMEKCEHNEEFSDGQTKIKYVRLYPTDSVSHLNQNFSDSALSTSYANNEAADSDDEFEENVDHKFDESIDDFDDVNESCTYEKYILQEKVNNKRKKRSYSEVCKKRKVIDHNYVLSFICRTVKTSGTLCVKKCRSLGVPYGPLLGELKRGENVVLPDGTIIKSSDVTEPDIPGAVIIFVECPREDYLDSLLKEPAFYRHQTGINSTEDLASIVVHFSSPEIIDNPKYQEWINRFSPETKHLYINKDNTPVGSIAVFRQQCKINLLHSEIFPMLQGDGISTESLHCAPEGHAIVLPPSEETEEAKQFGHLFNEDKVYYKCESNYHIKAEALSEIYLRPKRIYDYSKPSIPNRETVITEVFAIEGFSEELEKFKKTLQEIEPLIKEGKQYPKLVFLGTGSSQPNKTRSTSAILVFVDEKRSILLDCGEGTFAQLYHFFGNKTQEVLRNINVIYVSHIHADHHLGLITILKEREEAFISMESEKLEESSLGKGAAYSETKYQPPFLLAPVQMTRWLDLFSNEFQKITHLYELIPNAYLVEKQFGLERMESCFKSVGAKTIDTILVDHCPGAFGVAITHKDGWKLTYSGDTRPCDNLIQIGMDSDILIHEATMEDILTHQASLKAHSTSAQAIGSGKAMKAKFTMLTHFSQRYPHLPIITDKFSDDVGIAFDNMMVPRNMLRILPKMNDVLKSLFSTGYEKMEERKFMYETKKKKMCRSDDIFF